MKSRLYGAAVILTCLLLNSGAGTAQHCAHERNYATGKTGSRIEFIAFHAKGATTWRGDHVQMGIAAQLTSIEQGFRIISSFPEWRDKPENRERPIPKIETPVTR